MAKSVIDAMTDSKPSLARLRGWQEIFGYLASFGRLAGYLAVFVSVLAVDELWNLVAGREKHSFDKFDELQ
jgi:hypothetical protein